MASQGGDASGKPISKLAQLQMRFQQRTQQDLELRRRELTTGNGYGTEQSTAAEVPPSAASSRVIGNGKVRQMFDERRRGAGIDRSNPLKPLALVPTLDRRTPPRAPVAGPSTHVETSRTRTQQLNKSMSIMSLKEEPIAGRRQANDGNNNKFNAAGTNRLKPVVAKKSPPGTASGAGAARRPPMSPRLGGGQQRPNAKQPAPASGRANVKSPVTKIIMNRREHSTPSHGGNNEPPQGTSKCRYCGRFFNTDRLSKHEAVCQRTMTTKRKIFDASKQRAKGTDTEKYVKRGPQRSHPTYSSAAQKMALSTGVKKSNWRKKHEEFIQAIRSAKQMQAHLARGGKLRDLPPPPPSENADYIQCPHCGRRFNQQAAERHIPRCATMVHNKPRRDGPPPAKKR